MKENKLLNKLDKIDGKKAADKFESLVGILKEMLVLTLIHGLIMFVVWIIALIGGKDNLSPILFGYIILLWISRQIIICLRKRRKSPLEKYDVSIDTKLDCIVAFVGIVITSAILYIRTDGKIIRTIILIAMSVAISIAICIWYRFIEIKHLNILTYVIVNIATFIISSFYVSIFIDGELKNILILGVLILILIFGADSPYVEVEHNDGSVTRVYK